MSSSPVTNYAASVSAKLKHMATDRKVNFQFILIRYTIERFLYRLALTSHAKQFVLKGGNLFVIWQNGRNYRPTMDSDFLCRGDTTEEHLKTIFTDVCNSVACQTDGIRFDATSVSMSPILKGTEYGGIQIMLNAYLGRASVRLQFDIGIGDTVTPKPEIAEFPVLLEGRAPKILIYSKETVIAEKFETMVSRGHVNSRMKDFYDIWLLSELFDFNYTTLHRAVCKTFKNRNVPIPRECPDCFTEEFYNDPLKALQWKAFIQKTGFREIPVGFATVVLCIKTFLFQVIFVTDKPQLRWKAGEGWGKVASGEL